MIHYFNIIRYSRSISIPDCCCSLTCSNQMKDTGVFRLSQVVCCPTPDLSYLFSLLGEPELLPRHIQTAGVLSGYLRDPSTRVESPPVTCGLREPLGVAGNEIVPGGLRHGHHHHSRAGTLGLVWNYRNSNNSQTQNRIKHFDIT